MLVHLFPWFDRLADHVLRSYRQLTRSSMVDEIVAGHALRQARSLNGRGVVLISGFVGRQPPAAR
jgi:hypothetical protein